jgi:hypothetical protein
MRNVCGVMCLASVLALVPREAHAMGLFSFLADLFGGFGRVVASVGESAGGAVVRAADSAGSAAVSAPKVFKSRAEASLPSTFTADARKGWLDPSGAGVSRREFAAARQAVGQPSQGKTLNIQLKDRKFPASAGWVKKEQRVQPWLGTQFQKAQPRQRPVMPVVVHYNYNRNTGQVLDPKVRTWNLTQTWRDAQRFKTPR